MSSPLTGRPKLRNFLPGACGGSSPPSTVLNGMTHALRCLHPHVVAFQSIVNVWSFYSNMNKVEASTLHLQASANNFYSTQPFSNTVPSLWQLEWRHAVLVAMPTLAHLLVGNYSVPDNKHSKHKSILLLFTSTSFGHFWPSSGVTM